MYTTLYTVVALMAVLAIFMLIMRVSPAEMWQLFVVETWKSLTAKEQSKLNKVQTPSGRK